MISSHYLIHAVTLLIIGVLVHKQFESEKLIGYGRLSAGSDTPEGKEDLFSREPLPSDNFEKGATAGHGREEIWSSVWCGGRNVSDRICLFHSLCYQPNADQFVFFIGQDSIVENLPELDIHSAVLELSSVANHNAHYFTFITLATSASAWFDTVWISALSLGLNRFKPDNLMHVLHDDILPLHHTLGLISNPVRKTGKFEVQMVFLEGWAPGEYADLYSAFSSLRPLFRENLRRSSKMTCFRNIYLGLSKATVWYQYGFTEPQGPLLDRRVTSREIRAAARYIRTHKGGRLAEKLQTLHYVLLSRKENRLILNEAQLSQNIAREFNVKVIHVSSETYTLSEMIALVSIAEGIVGMHGALMSLALFLKPGSVVIELFPFGVNPNHYTPYRTLANIPGMELVYRPWRNQHAAKTVSHPDRLPELGGIRHLSNEEQSQILSETEIRPHLCCSNPSWLFRIYQDTVVNVNEVLELMADARQEATDANVTSPDNAISIFPSMVQDTHCSQGLSSQGEVTLSISWSEPWNIPYLNASKLHYEVLVSEENREDHVKYLVSGTKLTLPSVNGERNVFLWIRAVVNDTLVGPFVNMMDCHT
ncbi:protein O-linked-mannose beta-1,4-N-acetylglucosaminyltransferase 2-like [Liolophura sinensis]|uniref:protein O-linked-mannose beta-1,4-N-acetylglucosaminyltransferase 2-like n=1 Tax=Liolophura sinensis TaxID=3198878 RepID=UPI0031580863